MVTPSIAQTEDVYPLSANADLSSDVPQVAADVETEAADSIKINVLWLKKFVQPPTTRDVPMVPAFLA